jgi:hypothetical protein
MKACIVLFVLVILAPALANADFLQYDIQTLEITGFHRTRRPQSTVRHAVLDTGAVAVVFPAIDASCPGRPEFFRLSTLSPPYGNAQLVPRAGLVCFRGERVTSLAEVDALFNEQVQRLLRHPVLALSLLAAAAAEVACQAPASAACAEATAARAQVGASYGQRDAGEARGIARAIKDLRLEAEAFKAAHPGLE